MILPSTIDESRSSTSRRERSSSDKMAESEQNGGRATQDWRLRACCPSEALLLLKFVSKVS